MCSPYPFWTTNFEREKKAFCSFQTTKVWELHVTWWKIKIAWHHQCLNISISDVPPHYFWCQNNFFHISRLSRHKFQQNYEMIISPNQWNSSITSLQKWYLCRRSIVGMCWSWTSVLLKTTCIWCWYLFKFDSLMGGFRNVPREHIQQHSQMTLKTNSWESGNSSDTLIITQKYNLFWQSLNFLWKTQLIFPCMD